MVTLGIDPHKHTHTAVAVDPTGRNLAQLTVSARAHGHGQLIAWARRAWPEPDRLWAVEDCRHVTTRLEADLLAAGERVVRVPPRLMAAERTGLRARGKSDPIDALAVARAALREPDLPVAEHHPATLEVKLLVDHREDLLAERTRHSNRLRWHLHQLAPDLHLPARSLPKPTQLGRVRACLADHGHDPVRVRICADLADRIAELTTTIDEVARDLTKRVVRLAPTLLGLRGVGILTAAKLLAETANPTRFGHEARFAMHAGAAPLPASSGQTQRHRLNRGGNRQLNAALYRIAVTQIRHPGPGRTYYQRRLAAGNTKREAIRALKRRIARRVYHLLTTDHQTTNQPQPAAA